MKSRLKLLQPSSEPRSGQQVFGWLFVALVMSGVIGAVKCYFIEGGLASHEVNTALAVNDPSRLWPLLMACAFFCGMIWLGFRKAK